MLNLMAKKFVFVSFIDHPALNYKTAFSTWIVFYPNVSWNLTT
nr:unnamed protein product [Callosobruchus chinensis]